jgi:uncharacterized protein (TIGR02001 family)
MMKGRVSRLAMATVLLAFVFFPLNTWAEEEDTGILALSNFSGTVTLATDYVFRGISQTDQNPAIQGSVDYAHPFGIYLGIWGSNVDSSISDGGTEFDFYGGYTHSWGSFSLDVGAIYYLYYSSKGDAGPAENADFWEGQLTLSYGFENVVLKPTITGAIYYSPDFYAKDGNAYYVMGSLGLSLPWELGLSFDLGYQDVDGDKTTPDGFDYTHWKIALTRSFLGFDLELNYQDTNEEDFFGDIGDDRVVFLLSRSF